MVRLIVIRGLDFPVPHYARFLQSFLGPRTSLDTRSEPGQIWCSNDVTPKVCDPPGEPVLGEPRAAGGHRHGEGAAGAPGGADQARAVQALRGA